MSRHEHHYVDLADQMIQSVDLFKNAKSVEKHLGESNIILSTLAMLSNPSMGSFGVFERYPVERLVVDEASQIDTLELMVRFDLFR